VEFLWVVDESIGRNLRDAVDGLLHGKRYLIPDRDPLFRAEFLSLLGEAGIAPVKPPARSPNLNAHAQRFLRPWTVALNSLHSSRGCWWNIECGIDRQPEMDTSPYRRDCAYHFRTDRQNDRFFGRHDITVSQTMLRHAEPDTTPIYTHRNFGKALDGQRV
jgi:hypothetical protein